MLKNKKVLVTGGAGFIGSHIVEELLKENAKVIVLDNLSTGNFDNLEPFLDKIEFIEGDITNVELLRKLTKDTDYIFHEAALTSVQRSVDDPIPTNHVNTTGTLNVLTAAKENNIKKVVYASSSSIYGNKKDYKDADNLYKVELMKPMPLSPYAASKLIGEYYCKVFSHVYKLDTVCLRYFNVFGPRQNPKSKYSAVIPLFITSLLKDEKPIIHSDGKQSRDFTFVKNVAKANILALKSDAKQGETINVACGDSISVNDVFNKIKDYLGKDIQPDYHPERKGDVRHSLADIKKAKELIGYEPYVSFDEGLKQTIDWYKENYKE